MDRERIQRFAYGRPFGHFIMLVILINAVIIGIDTYIDSPWLHFVEQVCLWIFVIEIALKYTFRYSTREYFADGWNIFDIVIVGAAFVPEIDSLATVLRVARVFRVLRLVKTIPELRVIVNVLIRSMISMSYIALLMAIVFFIYGVIGVQLFGEKQPEFATLHESLFTLFRALTAEDWTDVRYDGIDEHGYNYWLVTGYHVSWILLSTIIMINLVIGAILDNYQIVQREEARRRRLRETQKVLKEQGVDADTAAKMEQQRIDELLDELREILVRRKGGSH